MDGELEPVCIVIIMKTKITTKDALLVLTQSDFMCFTLKENYTYMPRSPSSISLPSSTFSLSSSVKSIES